MVKKMACAAVLAAVVAGGAYRWGNQILCEGFLPPNNMKIPVGDVRAAGISAETFNSVLDRIEKLYGPVIAAKGGRLVVNRKWDDPTVNASANQMMGNWYLNMYGGLARHKAVTAGGFALVACHELGHHIGGFPKKSWATNEGGADYFATLKCLRLFFGADAADGTVDPTAKAGCAALYPEGPERNRCENGTMAGVSVSSLLAELGGKPQPSLTTPDPSVVERTNDAHPAAQCRLDTYYSGARCAKPVSEDVSNSDPSAGACTEKNGFQLGLRPRCWYKPPATEPSLPPQLVSARVGMPSASALQQRLEGLREALGRGY